MDKVTAGFERRETKSPREGVLRDFVRYSRKATRGLASAAEAEGRALVQRMIEGRRITPEQGEKLLATLLTRMEMSRETFEKRVDESIRKAAERLEEISRKELSKLSEQTQKLEQRLQKLTNK